MILDAVRRFVGNAIQPDKVTEARAVLAEAMRAHDTAKVSAEKSAAAVERVEQALSMAVERIDTSLEAARSARAARQNARAAALTGGHVGLTEEEAELAGRERSQLTALSDARLERRAAESALPGLQTAAEQAAHALRIAEEHFTNTLRQVVAAQVEQMVHERQEALAAEFSELTRWRAAACELGCKVAPPPRLTYQFAPEHMQKEMGLLKEFRGRLENDPEARFNV